MPVTLSKWPVIGIIVLMIVIMIPLIVTIVNLSTTKIVLDSVPACSGDAQIKTQAYPAIQNSLIATVLTAIGALAVIILGAWYLYQAQTNGYTQLSLSSSAIKKE